MNTSSRARPRRNLTKWFTISVTVAVLASIGFASLGSAESSCCDTQSSRIYFMTNPFLGMSLSLAADLSWDSILHLTPGETGSIQYAFSPGPAAISVFLPLSRYLGAFGIEDVQFDIPLGDTPLEEFQLSLTGLLGIPEWLASVDFVIIPSLALSRVTCTNPLDRIAPEASTMTWHDWSGKSITYVSDEVGEAVLSASFSYTVSIGIELTMIAGLLEHDLVPEINLLAIKGSQMALTSVDICMPAPSWTERNGLAALSFVVEGFAIYAVLVAATKAFEDCHGQLKISRFGPSEINHPHPWRGSRASSHDQGVKDGYRGKP